MTKQLLAFCTALFILAGAAIAGPGPLDMSKKKKKRKDKDQLTYGLQLGVSYNNYIYPELALYRFNPGRLINKTFLAGVEATQIKDSNFYAPKIGFHCQMFRFVRFGTDMLCYTDFKTGNILPILRPHIGASVHGDFFIVVGQNFNFFTDNKWSPRIGQYQFSVLYRLDLFKTTKKKKKKND